MKRIIIYSKVALVLLLCFEFSIQSHAQTIDTVELLNQSIEGRTAIRSEYNVAGYQDKSILIASSDSLYNSTDQGDSWQLVDLPDSLTISLTPNNFGGTIIFIQHPSPNHIVLGAKFILRDSSWNVVKQVYKIYYTSNKGQTWLTHEINSFENTPPNNFQFKYGRLSFTLNRYDAVNRVIDSSLLHVSIDSGYSWTVIPLPEKLRQTEAYYVDSNSYVFINAAVDSLYFVEDIDSMQIQATALSFDAMRYSFVVFNKNHIAHYWTNNLRTTFRETRNGGQNWKVTFQDTLASFLGGWGFGSYSHIDTAIISAVTKGALYFIQNGDSVWTKVTWPKLNPQRTTGSHVFYNTQINRYQLIMSTFPDYVLRYTLPHRLVGLEKNNKNKSTHVLVFPNPSSGLVTFSLQNEQRGQYEMQLFNGMGQLMKRYMLYNSDNYIDLSIFPSGIYMYQLNDKKGGSISGKLMKN